MYDSLTANEQSILVSLDLHHSLYGRQGCRWDIHFKFEATEPLSKHFVTKGV